MRPPDMIDEAAATLRFSRFEPSSETPADPDATSIYDLRGAHDIMSPARRLIQAIRRDIKGLRTALAEGWDVGPELAYEERRLARLEVTA